MAQLLELEHLPIRLTARGEWLHGTVPLHPRVAILFAQHVVPEGSGNYRIELGRARHPLEVEDTAFSVRSLDVQMGENGLQAVGLHLSDGAQEMLDVGTLMQSAQHVLYCRIVRHGWSVPARFTAQQYHTLALHMQQQAEHYTLPVGGQHWPIHGYWGETQAPLPRNTANLDFAG